MARTVRLMVRCLAVLRLRSGLSAALASLLGSGAAAGLLSAASSSEAPAMIAFRCANAAADITPEVSGSSAIGASGITRLTATVRRRSSRF